jgi:cardiolipin synthase
MPSADEPYNVLMSRVSRLKDEWDSTALVDDATAFFEAQLDAIGRARHSIDFEYYIFNADSLGRRFIDALGAAARRGVTVRVLIDGIGSSTDGARVAHLLDEAGVQVRIYHPLPWLTNALRWSRYRGRWLFKFLVGLLNINRRNHRKLCIVDGVDAWIGSLNISAQHLPVEQGGEGWRDYGVALRGEGVDSLANGFDNLWQGGKPRFHRGFIRRYLSNRSTRARLLKNRFVARSVENAARRVWLVSAYYAPTARFRRALLRACRSGAEVKLLLPGQSDVTVFPGLSTHYYRELLRAGARLFLYQPSVLHAKALLIDDFFILGSSNWNHRSTLHDLELDVVVRDERTVRQLEDIIESDLADARELSLDQFPSPSLGSWLWYAFRYWM